MSDLNTDSPQDPPDHRQHDACGGNDTKPQDLFLNETCSEEKENMQKARGGSDSRNGTVGEMVKYCTTEIEQNIPTGSTSEPIIITKAGAATNKAPPEDLSGTCTDSVSTLTNIVNEGRIPLFQGDTPDENDRSARTSGISETEMLQKRPNDTDIQLLLIKGKCPQPEHKLWEELMRTAHSFPDANVLTNADQKVMQKRSQQQRTMPNTFPTLLIPNCNLRVTLSAIPTRQTELENDLKEIEQQYKAKLEQQVMKVPINTTAGKRKFEFSALDDKFVEVKTVAFRRDRRLVGNELQARGKGDEGWQRNTGQNDFEEFNLDDLVKCSFGNTGKSRTTLVIGASGIGKSTMIQKILHDWSRGKIYQQFKFIFPFTVQQLNSLSGKISLNTLILDSYPGLKDTLENICSKPEEILFIFDDIDQLQQVIDFSVDQKNYDPKYQLLSPSCSCEFSDIVRCLIEGELLNGCSVLITSKHWKLDSVQQANINLTVEIEGFTPSKIRQYVGLYYGNESLAADVIEHLEQDEALYSMCFNPLFCSVLCALLDSHLKHRKGKEPMFVTSVQVFSAYVTSLLDKYGRDTVSNCDMLLKMGALAFNGICRKKVVFNRDDFQHRGFDFSNFYSAFMMEVPDKLQAIYQFTQPVLQDFIAALAKILITPGNDLTRLLNDFYTNADDRFKVFSRFLVGLSSYNLTGQIQELMGKVPSETSSCVSDWLKTNVQRRAQSLEDGQSQKNFLQMLDFFREFGDFELMAASLTPLKKIILTKCPLKPYDCMVLSSTLDAVELMEELNLDTCGVQDKGVRQLQHTLHKCKILRLKSNTLTDHCVETLLPALHANHSITELDLSNDSQGGEHANRITEKSVISLHRLMKSSRKLKEVRLINNQNIAENLQILNFDNDDIASNKFFQNQEVNSPPESKSCMENGDINAPNITVNDAPEEKQQEKQADDFEGIKQVSGEYNTGHEIHELAGGQTHHPNHAELDHKGHHAQSSEEPAGNTSAEGPHECRPSQPQYENQEVKSPPEIKSCKENGDIVAPHDPTNQAPEEKLHEKCADDFEGIRQVFVEDNTGLKRSDLTGAQTHDSHDADLNDKCMRSQASEESAVNTSTVGLQESLPSQAENEKQQVNSPPESKSGIEKGESIAPNNIINVGSEEKQQEKKADDFKGTRQVSGAQTPRLNDEELHHKGDQVQAREEFMDNARAEELEKGLSRQKKNEAEEVNVPQQSMLRANICNIVASNDTMSDAPEEMFQKNISDRFGGMRGASAKKPSQCVEEMSKCSSRRLRKNDGKLCYPGSSNELDSENNILNNISEASPKPSDQIYQGIEEGLVKERTAFYNNLSSPKKDGIRNTPARTERGVKAAGDAAKAKSGDRIKEIQDKHKEALRQQCDMMKLKSGALPNIRLDNDKCTTLFIVTRPPRHFVATNELYAISRKPNMSETERSSDRLGAVKIGELFRSSCNKKSPSGTLVVAGYAGIGKTAMMKEIALEWEAGKTCEQFNFVFLFKFRDLSVVKEKTSLKQLLLHSYSHLNNNLACVWKEPERILFLLDGLNEFHNDIDFRDQSRKGYAEDQFLDPECQVDVSDIIRSLVQGKLLKGCTVLITSRPAALESLNESHVNVWAEILGLIAGEKIAYCRSLCRDFAQPDTIFKYIEKNDVLNNLCYIPWYSRITCSALSSAFMEGHGSENQHPESITELLCYFVTRQPQKTAGITENWQEVLLKLGQMAYEGMRNGSRIFYDEAFQRHKLQHSPLVSKFMTSILHEDNSAKARMFLFFYQEFLAALSLFLHSRATSVKRGIKEASSKSGVHCEVFVQFLVGFTSPYSIRELKSYFGSIDSSVYDQVLSWLKEEIKQSDEKAGGHDKKTKFMSRLYLIYESRNVELTELLLASTKKVDFSGLVLSQVDCMVLATALKSCDILEEMDLSQCSIQSEGMQRLTGVVHKCKILRLNENKLADKGVKILSTALKKNKCNLQILELRANDLTNDCMKELTSAISGKQSLVKLDLSNNNQNCKHANALSDGSSHALQQLIQLSKSLREIRLSSNQFSESAKEGFRSQQQSRPELTVLV